LTNIYQTNRIPAVASPAQKFGRGQKFGGG